MRKKNPPLPLPINNLKRRPAARRKRIHGAVERVLESGWYVLGPELEAFEEELAAFVGTKHAIGVANGTDALELSLRLLECGQGDEIITVANAGGYSVTAILKTGATPVCVDVDAETLNMSPTELEVAITDRTKAIIVTHLYGRMAELEKISAIADDAGLPLIEDCAQAHGATKGRRRAGSWGLIGCFSFYPTKNLGAFGDAGALATDDAQLAETAKQLRQYGWKRKYETGKVLGMNSRMDEIQAAILRELLSFVDEDNLRRRAIIDTYRRELSAKSELILPPPGAEPDQTDFAAHLCILRSRERDAIRLHLAAHQIASDIHYPVPDHKQAAFNERVRVAGPLRETERAVQEILTVPCFPEMTAHEIDMVVSALVGYDPGASTN